MARQAKRKMTPRPGWIQAARALGVTYSHLRRVLLGEREGKSLAERFLAWQRQQPPEATAADAGASPKGAQ